MGKIEIAVTATIVCLVFGLMFFFLAQEGNIKYAYDPKDIKFCYNRTCLSWEECSECIFDECNSSQLIEGCDETIVKNAICTSCEGCVFNDCGLTESIEFCSTPNITTNVCVNITEENLNISIKEYNQTEDLVLSELIDFLGSGVYELNTSTNHTIKIYIGS